ncbi:MAG TPA: nucleoside hydrolase [Hellea balneolensis]|uniref:Nucleoside hydrolase n=1 Tax=Hellea balneolensis TaxID=287478 RepID=A0A7C3GL06_9PROT|nr:nucleoside hydrolase [Hellea balneolensis]
MLMLALAHRDVLDIVGITTVAGNVGVEKTARNARIICEMCGATDISVFAGCAAPLEHTLATAAEVHGAEGLNGVDIYEPAMPLQDIHAVDFMSQSLHAAAPASITIVITGPMTNLATVLEKDPALVTKIKEIIVMGGARTEGGNITPSAEYNIYADPHAAAIIYASGVRTVTIGLDVTHRVLSTPTRLAPLKAIGSKVADAAYSILGPHSFYDQDIYFTDGAPLHDPCTIAYVLKPELFTLRDVNISVETSSPLTRGHTAIDYWHRTNRPKNALWADDIDVEGVYALLSESLKVYAPCV